MSELPTYYVDADGGECSFRCPVCGKTHWHSTPKAREHRASHCDKQPEGYYIERK